MADANAETIYAALVETLNGFAGCAKGDVFLALVAVAGQVFGHQAGDIAIADLVVTYAHAVQECSEAHAHGKCGCTPPVTH